MGGIVRRCRGFTLIEVLVASGIVSVLTVMISVIICNVTKIVSLHTDSKKFEKNIVLNDVQAWTAEIDSIVLSDINKDLKDQIWFDVDENTRQKLPFLSYDGDYLTGRIVINRASGIFVIEWDRRSPQSFLFKKDDFLGKFLILADNAKDCYLRPLYTKKFFEKKSNAKGEKGDFKNINSWNNNKKIKLCYNNVKKLQEMKKKGEIAGVQLVVEQK